VVISHENKPLKVTSRVTSSDFFSAFDVPFLYGSGWGAQADTGAEPVIVLSHDLNGTLFSGINSVGRTVRWNDHEFRVIGVLAQWQPQPKFYDLTTGSFNEPEGAYVPWGWSRALQLRSSGTTRCWKVETIDTFEQLVGSECAWVQMWVELGGAAARDRMQAFIDAYWAEQRKGGRFPRPRNNRLTDVPQWLEDNQVVHSDDRLLVGLAFCFLGVCLLNTVGLLLAKFLNGAAVAGVRRALGASRGQIFNQHLVQAGLLAVASSFLGLVLSYLLLLAVRALYGGDPETGGGGFQALTHFHAIGIVWAIALALLSLLIAGIYPAWRIGRLPPARYLKSQ
jgi:putative ABC transport system permease protein